LKSALAIGPARDGGVASMTPNPRAIKARW
jgi:hypothetical protein